MRLWSLHPSYLDQKGLVALWREALLARKVLENKTKGYKKHPQLIRFKNTSDPLMHINAYISFVYQEAIRRNYTFNRNQLKMTPSTIQKLRVTDGQLAFEFAHLLKKLKKRDYVRYKTLCGLSKSKIKPHPLFNVVHGKIEEWEKSAFRQKMA